jgi:hypothetical protein
MEYIMEYQSLDTVPTDGTIVNFQMDTGINRNGFWTQHGYYSDETPDDGRYWVPFCDIPLRWAPIRRRHPAATR